MKKVVSMILALAMVFACAAALAEEEIELDRLTTTGNTTVSLTVSPARDSYTVIIP